MKPTLRGLVVLCFAGTVTDVVDLRAQERARESKADHRIEIVARAKIWTATDIPAMDLRLGPAAPDSFAAGATVECDYLDKKLSGNSPKFACKLSETDEVKVKFGGSNGEVYAEVAASRLLWALGFGADGMYPVRVICRGCPRVLGGIVRTDGTQLFDPASIERKKPGTEITPGGDEGWSWKELDRIDETAAGARKAERDALKLLAVFMQHTDTKPQQQRILCLVAPAEDGSCGRPFMMINDIGLTFGRTSWTNGNDSGANLKDWSSVLVWKGDKTCVGNLSRSFTGTLNDPPISEDGRSFLASLLTQLSDQQLYDLFEVARFNLRPRDPDSGRSGFPAIQEWVDAFKDKRRQIAERRCA